MNALIDTDVHVRWEQDTDLLPYLDKTWHSRWLLGRGGHTAQGLFIEPKFYDPDDPHPRNSPGLPGLTTVNIQAAANPATLDQEWLEPQGITAAVISCYDAALISTYADSDYPTEVAQAVNRWMTDHFLSKDKRLFGSITVATQDPARAAQEIRRAAQHPQMAQVVLSSGARMPYGHKYYRPSFRRHTSVVSLWPSPPAPRGLERAIRRRPAGGLER